MRAPPRALDEIIWDIKKALVTDASQDADASEAAIRFGVTRLKLLADTPIWGNRTENVDAIGDVQTDLERLLESIRKLPDRARFLLFAPEGTGAIDDVPSAEVQREAMRRARQTTALHAWLRTRCEQILAKPPGVHGAAKHLDHYVAEEAADLLRFHGKTPASGATTSLYGQVATLLFEMTTGEPGKDLEHACRGILKASSSPIDGD